MGIENVDLSKEELKRKVINWRSAYIFDKKELSKIVFITSFALLVVSINSVMMLNEVESDLKSVDSNIGQASAVINSENFQNALNTLERVRSSTVSQQLQVARNSFQQVDRSFQRIEKAETGVSKTIETYQWMSLISILGIVSSVALRFS